MLFVMYLRSHLVNWSEHEEIPQKHRYSLDLYDCTDVIDVRVVFGGVCKLFKSYVVSVV